MFDWFNLYFILPKTIETSSKFSWSHRKFFSWQNDLKLFLTPFKPASHNQFGINQKFRLEFSHQNNLLKKTHRAHLIVSVSLFCDEGLWLLKISLRLNFFFETKFIASNPEQTLWIKRFRVCKVPVWLELFPPPRRTRFESRIIHLLILIFVKSM